MHDWQLEYAHLQRSGCVVCVASELFALLSRFAVQLFCFAASICVWPVRSQLMRRLFHRQRRVWGRGHTERWLVYVYLQLWLQRLRCRCVYDRQLERTRLRRSCCVVHARVDVLSAAARPYWCVRDVLSKYLQHQAGYFGGIRHSV